MPRITQKNRQKHSKKVLFYLWKASAVTMNEAINWCHLLLKNGFKSIGKKKKIPIFQQKAEHSQPFICFSHSTLLCLKLAALVEVFPIIHVWNQTSGQVDFVTPGFPFCLLHFHFQGWQFHCWQLECDTWLLNRISTFAHQWELSLVVWSGNSGVVYLLA